MKLGFKNYLSTVFLKLLSLTLLSSFLMLAGCLGGKIERKSNRSGVNSAAAFSSGEFQSSTNISKDGFTLNWTEALDSDPSKALSTGGTYCVCSGGNLEEVTNLDFCLQPSQLVGTCRDSMLSYSVTGSKPQTTYFFNVYVKNDEGAVILYEGKEQATLAESNEAIPANADKTTPMSGEFSSSTGLSAAGVTLNWTAAKDNVTLVSRLVYFICSASAASTIDTVDKCLASRQEMSFAANTLTKAVSGLLPLTTYYFNVAVQDEAGNRSLYNGVSVKTLADTTPPIAGTFAVVKNVSESGMTVDWSAASDSVSAAASLQYLLCAAPNAAAIDTFSECESQMPWMAYSANTLTYTASGLTPGSTYYLNVIVKDVAGNRSIYPGVSQVTTADSTPPIVGTFAASTGVTTTDFTLNWTPGSDSGTPTASLLYLVCLGASAGAIDDISECEGASVMSYTANTLTYAVSGNTASTTYYYNVVVKDAAGLTSIYPGKAQTTSSAANVASNITVVEPSGANDVIALNGTFNITYTPTDPDDNAEVTLYRSGSSANCSDGSLTGWTQIVTGLAENTVSSYSWDTNGLSSGNYYICAKIDDSVNTPVYEVSSSYVQINSPPSIAVVDPATAVATNQVSSFTVNYTPADSDDDAVVTLYFKSTSTTCSAALTGWTQIVTSLLEDTTSSYVWTTNAVAAGTYYICARISDSINPPVFAVSTGTLQINDAPTLVITEPAGANDTIAKNATFSVTISATDADDNASISLFYSTTTSNCTNGALTGWTSFATGLPENSTTSNPWDTTGITTGNYYVCGKIDDSKNPAVYALSSSYLKIDAPPTITMNNPTTAVVVPQVGDYTLTYTPADSDDNASVTLYYKTTNTSCDNTLTGWTQIVAGLAENTVSSYSWTTTAVTAGTYYICSKISDSVNPNVFSVSTGTIKINAVPTVSFTAQNVTTYLYSGVDLTVEAPFAAVDVDDVATVTLYQRSISSGACTVGNLILTPKTEGVDTSFTVDTSAYTAGLSYLCLMISDGVNPAVSVWSSPIYTIRSCEWTGATNTEWATASNWNSCDGVSPSTYSRVLIPTSAPLQPTVSATTSIVGFGPGVGGGVVTIAAGAHLVAQSSLAFYFESDITLQGDSSTCTTCYFEHSNAYNAHVAIKSGATLILGHGLKFTGSSPLQVGTTTSPGNLYTLPDSGNQAEYPVITSKIDGTTNQRGFIVNGSAGQKSKVKITGLVLDTIYSSNGYGFDFQTNFEIENLDGVIVTANMIAPVVNLNCGSATLTDTTWSNWVMNMAAPASGRGTVHSNANCSASGSISFSGSGIYYGPAGEYGADAGNIFSWTNGTSFTCTWTGASSSDWLDPTNWSGCVNGRGGYPDFNDIPFITNVPATQPLVNTRLAIKTFNTGVSAGTGGTLTLGSSSLLTIDELMGDLTVQGVTTTCTTCIIENSPKYFYIRGSTTTLYVKSGVTIQGAASLIVNANGPRIFVDIASDDINEWPIFKVTASFGSSSRMHYNGVRFLKPSSGYAIYATGSGAVGIEKFDRMIFDITDRTDGYTGTFIFLGNCHNWSSLDTTWSEIDFVDGLTGAGRNIAFNNCSTGPAAGSVTITPRTGGTNNGYGVSYSTDDAGIVFWQ